MSNPAYAPSGFDVVLNPSTATFATPYTANDVVGGLLTFPVAAGKPACVMVTGVNVGIKAAVTSTLTLVLFDAAPGTAIADNAALALAAADLAKLIKAIPVSSPGGVSSLFDLGTPNTYSADGLNIPCVPADGQNLYGWLVDGTGFTLTGTSDIIVRLRGVTT
jgi:hypothetical protein